MTVSVCVLLKHDALAELERDTESVWDTDYRLANDKQSIEIIKK